MMTAYFGNHRIAAVDLPMKSRAGYHAIRFQGRD